MADTHAEHRFHVGEQREKRRQSGFVLLRPALLRAAAIFWRKALAHQHHAGGRQAVDREAVGMAKMTINHLAAAGGHGHQTGIIGLRLSPGGEAGMKFGALMEDGQPVGEAVRVRKLGKLLAAVFAQHADGVGAALVAMRHLRHRGPALAADRGEHPGVRLWLAVEAKDRAVLRSGNQRHNIVNKCAAFPQTMADLGHAAVVDPGISTEFILTSTPALVSLRTLQLAGYQDLPASRPR